MKALIKWGLFSLLGFGVLMGIGWHYAFSSEPLAVGTQAPDFALQDQNGKTRRLSDYKGQYVALMFFPKAMTPG